MSSPGSSSAHNSPEPSESSPMLLEEEVARYLSQDNAEDGSSDSGDNFGTGFEPQHTASDSSPWNNTEQELSHSGSDTSHELSTSSRRNEVAAVARYARRHKLHPYQITEVEKLVTSPLAVQLGTVFTELLAVQNKLHSVIVAGPPFAIGDPLAETIKSYALGVLLSQNLSAYKGVTTTNHVFAIIRKNNVNIPPNLDQDPYALGLVRSTIGSELIQARARIKRLVAESITKDWSIFTLANKVIEGSQCTVSAPLCARLAVMRGVYPQATGHEYWDKIDARLEFYRNKAKGNANDVRKILIGTLKSDRSRFGVLGPQYTIPSETGDFQQNIDSALSDRHIA